METITFYSYKGGAGRTLALANIARYLARLGKSVFTIDFDLEAPGLHYKLNLNERGEPIPIQSGLVDYILTFVTCGKPPQRLTDYVATVPGSAVSGATIWLLPAGDVPSADYWRKLSQINWHELFYTTGAKGVSLFLDLKERIAAEYSPDFLLIDSRTGITEVGGVATTVLPDKVVCLVLNNRENLDGARAVLRSIKRTVPIDNRPPIQIVVALTRIPQGLASEEELLEAAKKVLNAEAENLIDTLSVEDMFVLHSEPELQVTECLRIGGDKSPDDSPLLRDYLRLFIRVIPKEAIAPQIGVLIGEANALVLEEPDNTGKALEELAYSSGHPDAYRALLKFYRLRKEWGAAVLAARRLWELTSEPDMLLWEVARRDLAAQSELFSTGRSVTGHPQFKYRWVLEMWRSGGASDSSTGERLADLLAEDDRESEAADVLLQVIAAGTISPKLIAKVVRYLITAKRLVEAKRLLDRFEQEYAQDAELSEAWAMYALSQPDAAEARRLVASKVAMDSLSTRSLYRVCVLAGEKHRAEQVLDIAFNKAVRRGPEALVDLGRLYAEAGRADEFGELIRRTLPDEMREKILRTMQSLVWR